MIRQSAARHLSSAPTYELGEIAGMEIGELIRRKRQEKGLSMRVLASSLGVHHSAVGHWESGLALPTNANMSALKAVLGIHETVEVSGEAPYRGKLVDDPDELAWLEFWRSLTRERKMMVTDLLHVGLPVRKAM